MKLLVLALVAAQLTGCAALFGDPRDRPYDPNYAKGEQLFDQIPNTEGEANRVCCGHLRSCQPWQSPRC